MLIYENITNIEKWSVQFTGSQIKDKQTEHSTNSSKDLTNAAAFSDDIVSISPVRTHLPRQQPSPVAQKY